MTQTSSRFAASLFAAITVTLTLWLATLPVGTASGLTVVSFA